MKNGPIDKDLLKKIKITLNELYKTRASEINKHGFNMKAPPLITDRDIISAKEETDVIEGEDNVEENILLSIKSALERIKNGKYGFCKACKKPIPLKRLTALPYAKYCVKCKEKKEKARGSYRPGA